jgi:hypothetical protein
MSWKNKVLRQKRIPDGWDLMEPTLEEFEVAMREAGAGGALPCLGPPRALDLLGCSGRPARGEAQV